MTIDELNRKIKQYGYQIVTAGRDTRIFELKTGALRAVIHADGTIYFDISTFSPQVATLIAKYARTPFELRIPQKKYNIVLWEDKKTNLCEVLSSSGGYIWPETANREELKTICGCCWTEDEINRLCGQYPDYRDVIEACKREAK